jgi:KDO2-lipid IV(A) lauroyltransferase
MKHLVEYAFALTASGLVRFLPRSARLAFGRALGSLVCSLDARHRRITFENVSMAFGDEKSEEEKWSIARGAFRHFGAMLLEMTTLGRPSAGELERLVEVEGSERYEEAKRRGNGVILVAAHLGNWELHAIAHGYRFGRIFLVAREQDNVYLNRWLERIRGVSGNEVVYRKAATTPVASWFALRTGAALVPVFCYPTEDGRYHAVYEGPLDLEPYQDLDQTEALTGLTQELVSIQERYIRRHPECWLWMHRRWKTRPPGGATESEASRAAARETLDEPAAAAELR